MCQSMKLSRCVLNVEAQTSINDGIMIIIVGSVLRD